MDIERELRLIRQELQRIAALGHPLPGLATREQAAKFLSVSTTTVDRMIHRGDLRVAPLKEGAHPRIPWGELHRLAEPKPAPTRRGAPRRADPARFDALAEVRKLKQARAARKAKR